MKLFNLLILVTLISSCVTLKGSTDEKHDITDVIGSKR